MSENKLRKCIRKGTTDVKADLSFTPVFVTDSKGKYLKCCATDDRIKFYCKSSVNSEDIKKWFKKNIPKLVSKYSRVRIYLWIGTCDLTVKSGRYIVLNKDSSVKTFKDNLLFLKDTYASESVKITFIHVPYYSIRIWNKTKGHKSPEQYTSDDETLNSRIDNINNYIDDLNSELSSYSPKINGDLLRSRKRANSLQRYSQNFKLLPDGIHPGTILAKAWFVTLVKIINRDCV